jgi:hypothetical protein
MRNLKALSGAFVMVSASISVPAFASTTSNGNIGQTVSQSTGQAFFQLSGTRTTKPACATMDRWVFDNSTTKGQAMISTLLTAYASRKQVAIGGTCSCGDWADIESVSYIMIID